MHVEGTAATVLALLRDGRRQAQDLADELGVDTSAVRRHLEHLRAEGLVDAEDVIAGPGRPKRMYGLTRAGRETFPRDYALLLELLIAQVEKTQGRAALEALVGALAKDLAAGVPREGSTAARLDALVAFYERLGFDASLERTHEGTFLVQRNCIFLKTATADPQLLCRCLDEGIISRALDGAKVDLVGSLATGMPHCRHRIDVAQARAKPRGRA